MYVPAEFLKQSSLNNNLQQPQPVGLTTPPCSTYVSNACAGIYKCPGQLVCAQGSRAVWGGAPPASMWVYTGDSSPCQAARHAGILLPGEGGVYQLSQRPGQSSYNGSENNGVRTNDWKEYHVSFSVLSAPVGYETANSQKSFGPLDCAEYAKDACKGTFQCKGLGVCNITTRAVWGISESGDLTFTGDSSICAAARFCGIITEGGGRFKIEKAAPLLKCVGAEARNGVTVKSWGAYENCFRVSYATTDLTSEIGAPTFEKKVVLIEEEEYY
jgi:hypothetical protein